eukprot:s2778_g3.t1
MPPSPDREKCKVRPPAILPNRILRIRRGWKRSFTESWSDWFKDVEDLEAKCRTLIPDLFLGTIQGMRCENYLNAVRFTVHFAFMVTFGPLVQFANQPNLSTALEFLMPATGWFVDMSFHKGSLEADFKNLKFKELAALEIQQIAANLLTAMVSVDCLFTVPFCGIAFIVVLYKQAVSPFGSDLAATAIVEKAAGHLLVALAAVVMERSTRARRARRLDVAILSSGSVGAFLIVLFYHHLHSLSHAFYARSLQKAYFDRGRDWDWSDVERNPYLPLMLFTGTVTDFRIPGDPTPMLAFRDVTIDHPRITEIFISPLHTGSERTGYVPTPPWRSLSKSAALAAAASDAFIIG